MELKDLFLTPLYLGLFYAIAYSVRPRFTNVYTKKYFIPALTVKYLGAITLGIIYKFYYKGGDTFNYYRQAKVLHEAFDRSLIIFTKLFNHQERIDPDMYIYTNRLYWYNAPTEYFIVKITAVLGLTCFNTYSVIALLFASISFCGVWALYITFVRISPVNYEKLALAVFFIPSVFFWGSGLMKDSLCLGALGWCFYGFYNIFIAKKNVVTASIVGFLGIYVILSIKIYILLSFMPPALFWVFNENNQRIKSATARLLLKPLFLIMGAAAAYYGATNLTAGDDRYDLDKIGERSRITKEYLSEYVTSGSAYDIGTLDGSIESIIKVAPQAIGTSLFRPFLWEVSNPVMMLSALEACFLLYLTLSGFYRTGFIKGIRLIASQPILTFCFIFSLVFAIGVGVNSGNFGTLVRYKIPLMPFFLSALYIMQSFSGEKNKKIKIFL